MSAQLPIASQFAAPLSLAAAAPTVGRLVRWDALLGPMVDFPGNAAGVPIAALALAQVGPELGAPHDALLVFADGDPARPVVIGVLRGPSMTAAALLPSGLPEAQIDGRRVVLDGRDEIVLRCGEASITLRRNGRVVIRGAYVETAAKGVNRVKGGSVKIN